MAKNTFGVILSTVHGHSSSPPAVNLHPMCALQFQHTRTSHLYPGNHVSSDEGCVIATQFISDLEVITLKEKPNRFTKTLRTQLPPKRFSRWYARKWTSFCRQKHLTVMDS